MFSDVVSGESACFVGKEFEKVELGGGVILSEIVSYGRDRVSCWEKTLCLAMCLGIL